MAARDRVLTKLDVATMAPGGSAYGLVADAAIALSNGRIAWVGSRGALPERYASCPKTPLDGRLVTPGLIDCHTHIIHGGHRAKEFEMRLKGASYADVARRGGGIAATVKATREATEDDLLSSALRRLDAMLSEGVTTIEVKSGYGLEKEAEIRMLRVARALARHRPVRVVVSYLGAHAVPPNYAGRAGAYLDEVCIPTLRAAHAAGLVDAVDGFCEGIAFSPDEISRLFDVAGGLGLPVKLHAEQLSNLGGAKLAARHGALSADHLEYLDEGGVRAMAEAGTVAVLLPGAFYTLCERQSPPIASLRRGGVPIAVATDCNPGSSPLLSPLMAMNMACTLFRLTPEEALAGVTCNAARALGFTDRGTIAPGQLADIAVWDVAEPAELAYRIGFNPLHTRIFASRL